MFGKRQLQFLGQILRAQRLESNYLLARINGKRAKGRQRKKYMDSLIESFSGVVQSSGVGTLIKGQTGVDIHER